MHVHIHRHAHGDGHGGLVRYAHLLALTLTAHTHRSPFTAHRSPTPHILTPILTLTPEADTMSLTLKPSPYSLAQAMGKDSAAARAVAAIPRPLKTLLLLTSFSPTVPMFSQIWIDSGMFDMIATMVPLVRFK